jgi:hypothetical protein
MELCYRTRRKLTTLATPNRMPTPGRKALQETGTQTGTVQMLGRHYYLHGPKKSPAAGHTKRKSSLPNIPAKPFATINLHCGPAKPLASHYISTTRPPLTAE